MFFDRKSNDKCKYPKEMNIITLPETNIAPKNDGFQ